MENAHRPELVQLLEAEKDPLMAQLAQERSPEAAQAAMERTLDRVAYRYVEACAEPQLGSAAQTMLTSLKSALPLMGAVNQTQDWKRSMEAQPKLKLDGMTLGMLIAGVLLVMATVLALYISSAQILAVLGFVRAVVPAALGGGLLFWAGLRAGRPVKKPDAEAPEDVRREYLVDAEDAWHVLRGAMVVADGDLNTLRERAAVAALDAPEEAQAHGPMTAAETELLSGLLEIAYVHRKDGFSEDAEEMISNIRFFLHGMGIALVDYSAEHAGWFELLPAPTSGTLRPAMVQEGKAIRKGLAATAGGGIIE